MAALLVFAILSILSISRAEDRAHGLTNETPIAISPQAYAFFHPNALPPTTTKPCDSSTKCSTLPLAAVATVQSTPAHESTSTTTGDRRVGAGAIAGISLSFVLVCIVGMGVYYVIIKRRANFRKANQEQQSASV
ncbi:hypothetical protein CDL12_15194 [Handroanthus impetiginosus]|uniref:Non-specific serine/threonine protein kinase n=1 Tax=Handroanthus impetiginosus TaxID=429701 RepID=A0A2G9H3U9_9LAMI|nr:hypothetical protein CDL12_15194 [Handroanthus impetiginosus]